MTCPNCNGTLWVCENHPDKEAHECPFCEGAGMPCECNPDAIMSPGTTVLWSVEQDSVGDRFAHRLAVMLELALLDPTGTWNDAHALLAEYHEALYERDKALGLPYVSGFGKD